jgi:hypothetical protein
MKKVLITNGWPLVYQPHQETMDAVIDGLKKLATPFGDCILSGCIIGGDTGGGSFPVSEGVVLLGGEVMRLPAQTIGTGVVGSQRVVYKSTINLVDYPVAHADGEVKPMVVENIAQLKNAIEVEDGEVAYLDLPRVDDKLINLFGGKWQQVTASGGCDFDIGIVGNAANYMSYIKDGSNVIIRGAIRIVGALANDASKVIFVLPSGFRPRLSGTPTFNYVFNTSGQLFFLRISGGTVSVTNKSGGSINNAIININDFRFSVDI